MTRCPTRPGPTTAPTPGCRPCSWVPCSRCRRPSAAVGPALYPRRRTARPAPGIGLLGWLALGGLLAMVVVARELAPWMYRGGFLVAAALSALVIASVTAAPRVGTRSRAVVATDRGGRCGVLRPLPLALAGLRGPQPRAHRTGRTRPAHRTRFAVTGALAATSRSGWSRSRSAPSGCSAGSRRRSGPGRSRRRWWPWSPQYC